MLTILVFETKKVKKILTIIYHYLLDGDSNVRMQRVWGHTPPKFMLTILVFEINEGKNAKR